MVHQLLRTLKLLFGKLRVSASAVQVVTNTTKTGNSCQGSNLSSSHCVVMGKLFDYTGKCDFGMRIGCRMKVGAAGREVLYGRGAFKAPHGMMT